MCIFREIQILLSYECRMLVEDQKLNSWIEIS